MFFHQNNNIMGDFVSKTRIQNSAVHLPLPARPPFTDVVQTAFKWMASYVTKTQQFQSHLKIILPTCYAPLWSVSSKKLFPNFKLVGSLLGTSRNIWSRSDLTPSPVPPPMFTCFGALAASQKGTGRMFWWVFVLKCLEGMKGGDCLRLKRIDNW